MPLIGGCRKALFELLVEDKVGPSKIKVELDFTAKGVTAATLNTFFSRALDAARKQEPIIESGNKYGVSDDFHTMNGQLIMHDVECSAWFAALSATDRERCHELMKIVLFNPELRNRNPLHPSVLDACVIGNLMNFPKHIFGMVRGSPPNTGPWICLMRDVDGPAFGLALHSRLDATGPTAPRASPSASTRTGCSKRRLQACSRKSSMRAQRRPRRCRPSSFHWPSVSA
jgi:hypothetical protein